MDHSDPLRFALLMPFGERVLILRLHFSWKPYVWITSVALTSAAATGCGGPHQSGDPLVCGRAGFLAVANGIPSAWWSGTRPVAPDRCFLWQAYRMSFSSAYGAHELPNGCSFIMQGFRVQTCGRLGVRESLGARRVLMLCVWYFWVSASPCGRTGSLLSAGCLQVWVSTKPVQTQANTTPRRGVY